MNPAVVHLYIKKPLGNVHYETGLFIRFATCKPVSVALFPVRVQLLQEGIRALLGKTYGA